MQRGRTAAMVVSIGILVGSACWGVSAALGLSALMLANAWVFEVIRYFGAAYLLWLAFKALRSAINTRTAVKGTPFSGGTKALFFKGVGLHITNPKAILSWASIYAIVAPANSNVVDLLVYFTILYSGSILIFIGYAILFSTPQIVAGYTKAQRWFDFAFAGFFGFASLKILTARLS